MASKFLHEGQKKDNRGAAVDTKTRLSSVSKASIYGAASGVVLAVLVMVALVTWYCCYKKRPPKGFQKLPEHLEPPEKQNINCTTPKIQLNTVEFTLPQGHQWSASCDDLTQNSELKTHTNTRNDVSLSLTTVQDPPGIATTVGLLKPELYDTEMDYEDDELPFGNMGRVWYSLEYDPHSEKLIVQVDRIRNLPGRQQRGSVSLSSTSSCDPFIRLYLLPDEKRYLQSKMKRKTRNPSFKETFMFTMSYHLLTERTLRITVFDVDRFMRQTTIGHALYPLTNLDVTMRKELWTDVEKSSQITSSSGRLQVGLSYNPHNNRVSVNVIRGQRIGNEENATPDSYVKITYSVLNKVHKVKKTHVQKNTADPFYNQTLDFKIDKHGLDLACLNFEVFQSVSAMVKNDKALGSFVIGGSLCTRGKELAHWADMIQKSQIAVKEWHDLRC